ncbi:ATP-dependent RNA helicase RhlE [Symmachiella dynata]|uniref:DEAD/DEAH box helicase n=1 Tax=Symmachiella dynata TaxID=2527995 RepID=UPI0011877944|nr:DEAD/DEAH box helicase [Symmachiella dynata]QDT49226.1 ATP-dependent RNA helicase RhlE [Symmachiella dynata]
MPGEKVTQIEENLLKTFQEIDLIAPVQRALADEKYETPTPIQAQTIPATMQGRDVLGCAQTGTGKTAAFAVPILNQLGQGNRKSTPKRPLVLALAPTRELAIQIGASFAVYGRHLKLRQALVYGGVNQGKQVRAMNRGAHILVATPGRLLDLMNQGHIKLDQLEMFVLDEADRMLDMGFLPDLKRIISHLPEKRQSLFFSATLPPSIIKLSQSLLHKPVSVNVTPETTSVERIEQRLLYVDRAEKKTLLKSILTSEGVDRALVFTKTKRTANLLEKQLLKDGITATAIHGDKSQNARQRALEAFRRKQVKVLVATDVAARGIDIDNITHVVNFDLPIEPENYVHRIGRTGRAGAEGIALSFCCADERRELRSIERLIGQKVPIDPELSLPEPAEFKSGGSSHRRRDAGSKRSKFKRSASKRSGAKSSGPKGPGAKGSGAKSSGAKSSGGKGAGKYRKVEAAGGPSASKPKRRPGRKPKKAGQRPAHTA